MSGLRLLILLPGMAGLIACASAPTPPPYPAFVQADTLPDVFMASLPGIRAKQFAGDPQARTTSNRIDLPASWQGTTGGAPGKALEIFVLQGTLWLADIELTTGGYAYVPPGSLGFNLRSDSGARILYFLDDVSPQAMIRTPVILDSGLLEWRPGDPGGTFEKELRADPGSGARTWLLRVDPGAALPWQSNSVLREGYLVSGSYRDSECVGGEPYTATYAAGGYFHRPANAVHGGPEAGALTEAVWLLREASAGAAVAAASCVAAAAD